MQTLITLEQLTKYSVNVKKETFVDSELVSIERSSYINDERGRAEVESELSESQKVAILSIWNAE